MEEKLSALYLFVAQLLDTHGMRAEDGTASDFKFRVGFALTTEALIDQAEFLMKKKG